MDQKGEFEAKQFAKEMEQEGEDRRVFDGCLMALFETLKTNWSYA
jgi:hypothetical protein